MPTKITVKPFKLNPTFRLRRKIGVPKIKKYRIPKPTSEQWPYSFPPPNGDAGGRLAFAVSWYSKDGTLNQGTLPEYAIFWALEKLGAEFSFQSSLMGGRHMIGGVVADFIVFSPVPNLIIRVQGEYFHYQQGQGKIMEDFLQKVALQSRHFIVIDIDALPALANPINMVQLAFAGIDQSQGARLAG